MARFSSEQLRTKALYALEEAVQECRYGPVRRTFAIRFCLAYLWSLGSGSRTSFERFWRALDEQHMWRFSAADQALSEVYADLGLKRDDEVAMRLWKGKEAEQG